MTILQKKKQAMKIQMYLLWKKSRDFPGNHVNLGGETHPENGGGRFPIWLYNIFQMGWFNQPPIMFIFEGNVPGHQLFHEVGPTPIPESWPSLLGFRSQPKKIQGWIQRGELFFPRR